MYFSRFTALGYHTQLERFPTLRVEPKVPLSHTLQPTTRLLTVEEKNVAEDALSLIKAHLVRRSTGMKEVFQSFDKLRTGRVTRAQFRQVLSWVEADVGDHGFEILCAQFTDTTLGDFCYLPFVARVDKDEDTHPNPTCPTLSILQTDETSTASPDVEQILHRLKTKVKTERIRVYDALRDFDPLHCGRITVSEFLRAIDRYQFTLTPTEQNALAQRYLLPKRVHASQEVDYRRFSDELESVFTQKNMEQNPTTDPIPFAANWHAHRQDPVERAAAVPRVLRALAADLKQRRMYVLLRYLEDHDKIHNGTITASQFRSAMSAAGCSLTLRDSETLCAHYALVDLPDAVDYLNFHRDLAEELAAPARAPSPPTDSTLSRRTSRLNAGAV
jgi:Ca2+-binding EF-hand superfamily protein